MKQKMNPKFIWGIFMSAIYIGISALLIFSNFFENISWVFRIILGVALFLYGIARGYRVWKMD